MRKFIIMGIQGSGKGTQAKLLADDLDLEHFSVGDIFRWNVQHHTKLGAQVKRIMTSGKLVDDDLVEAVVRECLANHDWNFGFVIDGFPRNATGSSTSTFPTRKARAGCWPGVFANSAGWTTTSSPTDPFVRVSATSARESWWYAPTTTRLRWQFAWRRTTKRPIP